MLVTELKDIPMNITDEGAWEKYILKCLEFQERRFPPEPPFDVNKKLTLEDWGETSTLQEWHHIYPRATHAQLENHIANRVKVTLLEHRMLHEMLLQACPDVSEYIQTWCLMKDIDELVTGAMERQGISATQTLPYWWTQITLTDGRKLWGLRSNWYKGMITHYIHEDTVTDWLLDGTETKRDVYIARYAQCYIKYGEFRENLLKQKYVYPRAPIHSNDSTKIWLLEEVKQEQVNWFLSGVPNKVEWLETRKKPYKNHRCNGKCVKKFESEMVNDKVIGNRHFMTCYGCDYLGHLGKFVDDKNTGCMYRRDPDYGKGNLCSNEDMCDGSAIPYVATDFVKEDPCPPENVQHGIITVSERDDFGKRCKTCGVVRPLDAFNKDKHGKLGVRARCRDCEKRIRKQKEKSKMPKLVQKEGFWQILRKKLGKYLTFEVA